MNELELAKMELDNHIKGLEICKEVCRQESGCGHNSFWSENDERTLQLMYRIQSILDRVEPKQEDDLR